MPAITRSKAIGWLLAGWTGLALMTASAAEDGRGARSLEIVGTEFRITTEDGRVLRGADVVGTTLRLGGPGGRQRALRIDAARPDPQDPTGELMLYTLMVQEAAAGAWQNLCGPDADGLAMGFPLRGSWTPTGEYRPAEGAFELACTSGAIGKCLRLGYRPWRPSAGAPLQHYLQACVRMVRADYCGDGVAHTREGTRINIYDKLGIQVAAADPAMAFEAAWGPDGAVCVRKVRVRDAATLEGLTRACPERLPAANVGSSCTEASARRSPEVLLLNQS